MKKHPIVVIKLGTSSIVHEETHQPLLSILAVIVETAVSLRQNGYKVVIVSSGAIGVSLWKMNLPRRPKHLPQVQALAAIGQCRLLGIWERLFDQLNQPIAQILLTRNDIADRTQYQNAQNTFNELLNMGVIPIVNENDTLSVAEIKFGDNDTLSAITAGMIQADYLFLMTDVDCLYDKNPRTHADAKAIEVVENIADLTADVSSAGSALGTGGMSTKIVAARLATAAGVTTIITRSSKPGQIAGIVEYIEAEKAHIHASLNNSNSSSTASNGNEAAPTVTALRPAPLHTRFLPPAHPIRDRHFWLLHGLAPHGTIYIDSGAAKALKRNAGLLPVGVLDADGTFAQHECVRIVEVDIPPRTQQMASSSRPQTLHMRSTSASDLASASNPSIGLMTPSTPSIISFNSLSNTDRHYNERAEVGIGSSGGTSNDASYHSDGRPPLSRDASSTSMSMNVSTHQRLQSQSHSHPHTPIHSHVHEPSLYAATGHEIGRAIVNYSSIEIRRIAGLKSTDIAAVLGYADSEYVALRENIALVVNNKRLNGSGPAAESSRSPPQQEAATRSAPVTPRTSTPAQQLGQPQLETEQAEQAEGEVRESSPSTRRNSSGRFSLGLQGYVEG